MLCTALVVTPSVVLTCKVVKRVQSSQGKEASLAVSIHRSTSDTSTTASNPDHPIEELDSSSYNELSLTTNSNSLFSDHQNISMVSSPDRASSSLDLSTSDQLSSSSTSDDTFVSDCSFVSSNSPPEIESDTLGEFLREQQTA